jgi:hypothetical protein
MRQVAAYELILALCFSLLMVFYYLLHRISYCAVCDGDYARDESEIIT